MVDENDLTRRTLLTSLGTVGGAGAVVGTGTAGLFTDREIFENSVIRAGVLDLLVSWNGKTSEDGSVTYNIDLSSEPTTGSETFTVELPGDANNPARVWLRLPCPEGAADSIYVELSYACNDETIAMGSLLTVANTLRNGILLDPPCATNSDGCLVPSDDLQLDFYWEFDPTEPYNGEDVTFEFDFRAIQCRNNPIPENPFPTVESCVEYYGISYIEIWADTDENGCDVEDADEPPGKRDDDFVGKLELTPEDKYDQDGIGDSYIEEGYYALYVDDTGEYTGYIVHITDTVTKDSGNETVAVEFELLEDTDEDEEIDEDENTGPDLCRVDIKGASGEAVYDESQYFDGNATDGLLYAPIKGGN